MITTPKISISNKDDFRELVNTYRNGFHYKTIKAVQGNTILNRAVLELVGADLPGILTELIGRNWQTAVEISFRVTLMLGVALFLPLALIPIWNNRAQKKYELPNEFKNLFKIQFEDLLPEKDPESLKQKLIEYETIEVVNDFLRETSNDSERSKINSLKEKLREAKCHVVKMDLASAGFLTYLVPWSQNFFAKYILGIESYTGEIDLLSESQQEESAAFHKRFWPFKFLTGLGMCFFGTKWYAGKIKDAATLPNEETSKSKMLSEMKKHISLFDIKDKIFSQRLNIFGTFFWGGMPAMMLSPRSINEFIERGLRTLVWFPTAFWGDAFLHSKFADKYDAKYDTEIVEPNAKSEYGIKEVKSLIKLDKAMDEALSKNDEPEIKKTFDSIKGQIKLYYLSMGLDALFMGIGLSLANIIGTKIRISKGVY